MSAHPLFRTSFLVLIVLLIALSARADFISFDPHGSGPSYPSSANGANSDKPTLEARRIINGGIKIDGKLDEASWRDAPAGAGFTQYEPERRGVASEQTVFKVVYDDNAIYIAVACLRSHGTPVTSCLSRRDQIISSDLIRVYISPYNDQTTGYHFRINPYGVKEDYYNYGDVFHDVSWDAVWEADTRQDADGWYAELRIPFSSVRYREADSMTWGFNVFQYIHSLGQRTAWSNWARDQSGFLSRSGTITGIAGIRPPRQLEITPYILGRLTDPSDPTAGEFSGEDWDHFGNFGADIKYGVTSDLTLSATIQPDFGQVEADPSVLNLSPFETYYQEKRPFFVDGAQFFRHPDFTMFYSRRIGTGSENSRIRAAAKLTGKLTGDVSTAVLVATTDETGIGQAHNFLKGGDRKTWYAIGRFGKQINDGQHSFNVMQTAVVRHADTFDYATRNGYTSGGDFELNFKDRMYQVTGSFVGSIIDPLKDPNEPSAERERKYGTGSRFELEKRSGDWNWALTAKHQGDGLDINDLGYISNPDHYATQTWVSRNFNGDGESDWYTGGNVFFRSYKSWIYADRSVADPNNPDAELWSYDSGHSLLNNNDLNGYLELRNRWGVYWGVTYNPGCTSQYTTRWTPDSSQRGPLMSTPDNYHGWLGFYTDSRRKFRMSFDYKQSGDDAGSLNQQFEAEGAWVVNSKLTCDINVRYNWGNDDAQWVRNVSNPDGGIGDVSYTFAELDQRTWDLTLRGSYLFERNHSLELYFQPFLTFGDYTNLRQLARPDSYDLHPFAGYDVAEEDFAFGAVNLNMVYRWEYRPGSTIFLAWSHARSDYDQRVFHGVSEGFDNDFDMDRLFSKEAENRFLLKASYWFSI